MSTKKSIPVLFLLCLLVPLMGTQAQAAPLAATFIPRNVRFETVATGLDQPLFATHAGDGSGRIFIVERGGLIKILKSGIVLASPFLNVSTLLALDGGEQGLLGLAFAPDYVTSGVFYISYTASDYAITLARYKVSAKPNVADPLSGQVLLGISKIYTNHNGGMLAFGSDGYLYMSSGDGGGGGDTDNNAQNRKSLLGKILRLDVGGSGGYTIPPTNPYYNNTSGLKKEIWAYGLRNAWRFSFDRSTHDLLIGDVGQNTQEEIDFQPAGVKGGRNYGWRIREGNLCYNPANCTSPANYVAPVFVYNHGLNDSYGCSVTGGYVYRGSKFPGLVGVYLYADFCSGKLWGLIKNNGNQWVSTLIADTDYFISSFGEDEDGEIYLLNYGGQLIHIAQAPIKASNFISNPNLDGYVVESSENSSVGGVVNTSQSTLILGDNAVNRQFRSFLSFSTGNLPDDAVILSATLKIKKVRSTAGDPFANLGPLVADMGKPIFGSGAALKSNDFQAEAGYARSAVFSIPPVDGWYSTSLVRASLDKINLTGYTQFRLRFTVDDDNDLTTDRVNFASGNATANKPVLVIQYFVP